MKEEVDADTWIGTASGYQRTLYYHVRRLENNRFYAIEWQCGYEYRKYFKSYPVLLFPPDYVEPSSAETGVYLHWISVIDPAHRTPMIMQGIQTVHNSEARSPLKAALEREAGLTEAAQGRHWIEADTIYVNAPIEMAAEFLGDLRTMEHWSHLLKPAGSVQPEQGVYLDEYRQTVEVAVRTNRFEEYYLVEQDYFHPQHNTMQRSPTFLIPLSHAFGDPAVPGFLLHRITFWKNGERPRHGKLGIEDFGTREHEHQASVGSKGREPFDFRARSKLSSSQAQSTRRHNTESKDHDAARHLLTRIRARPVSILSGHAR